MDLATLVALYRDMITHVETLNREMGMVVARLDWIEWWIKTIVGGTIANALVSIVNVWLTYKSKNDRGNQAKNSK